MAAFGIGRLLNVALGLTLIATVIFFGMKLGGRQSTFLTLSDSESAYFISPDGNMKQNERRTRAFQASASVHMDESFFSDYGLACTPMDENQRMARQDPCGEFQRVYTDAKTSDKEKERMVDAAQMVFAELTSFGMMQSPGGMNVFNDINSSQYDVKPYQQVIADTEKTLLTLFKAASNDTVGDYSASNFTAAGKGAAVWTFLQNTNLALFEKAQRTYQCMLKNAGNQTMEGLSSMDPKKQQERIFPTAAQTPCNIQNYTWQSTDATTLLGNTDQAKRWWAECFTNATSQNTFFNFITNAAVLLATDSSAAVCVRNNLVHSFGALTDSEIAGMSSYTSVEDFVDRMGGIVSSRQDVGPYGAGTTETGYMSTIINEADTRRMTTAFYVLLFLLVVSAEMAAQDYGFARYLAGLLLVGIIAIYILLMASVNQTEKYELKTQLSSLEAAGQCQLKDVQDHLLLDRYAKRETVYATGLLILFTAIAAMFLNVIQVVQSNDDDDTMKQQGFTFVCAVLALSFFFVAHAVVDPVDGFKKKFNNTIVANEELCPSKQTFNDIFETSDRNTLNALSITGIILAFVSIVAVIADRQLKFPRENLFKFVSVLLWATTLVFIGIVSFKLQKAHEGLYAQTLYHAIPTSKFMSKSHQEHVDVFVGHIVMGVPIIAMLFLVVTIIGVIMSKDLISQSMAKMGAAFSPGSMHGFM